MLVNSFDTKYANTASKYESLDNSFTKILGSKRKFSRIFTSVIENKSFKEVLETLDKFLKNILKKKYTYVFTDPNISKNTNYLLDHSSNKNKISKFVNIFKKNIKAPFELNLEKDFFSQNYHQDIFFYVYSNISKKIIAQGGGYQYKKNIKKIDGFGFSCNVDYIAELT